MSGPSPRGLVGSTALILLVVLVFPKRCSRAIRLAAVSRANLGVFSFVFLGGIVGVFCWKGVIMRSGRDRGALLLLDDGRIALGKPRPAGCLMNFDSFVAEVGKSSNTSSSVPSPKLRRRVGRVTVFLAAASRARAAGATSARLERVGVSGTKAVDRREKGRGGGDWGLCGSESRRTLWWTLK